MSTVKHGLESWEIKFAATICILGWFFSRKFWIDWLNWVDPVIGLLSWYIVMAAFIWIWIHGKHVQVGVTAIKQWGWMTTLGALMIMYAFWMVFNWTESQLPSIYAGMGENVPNTLLATEDGVVFYYIYGWAKTLSYPVFWWSTPVSLTADLTYVVIPPLLILIAGAFFVTASRMRRIVAMAGAG